ncbi:MAG: response regulator [Acidobacteriota bacterium]
MVDDSPDIRGMWLTWLSLSGFVVDEAENGAEAVARARAHRPDMVLMDLTMPVMDGIEAIKRLRADDSTTDVPIIALTALDADDSVRRARDAGADAYVRKPVSPEELLEHMQRAFTQAAAPGLGLAHRGLWWALQDSNL